MDSIKESNDIKELGFGDHICYLYDDFDRYRKFSINYIIKGLLNNEKVLCVIDKYPKDILIEDLSNNNIDVECFIELGQLVIVSNRNVYSRNSGFEPAETMDYWKRELKNIEKESFSGLRTIGEMDFALDGTLDTIGKLMEYELRSNTELLPLYDKALYSCVFNKSKFPDFVLADMVKKHNVVINDGKIIKPNPYFIAPKRQLQIFDEKKCMKKQFSFDINKSYNQLNSYNNKNNIDINILKYVLKTTGDGVWEWSNSENGIYLNYSFYKMLGYRKKDNLMKYEDFLRLVHSEDSRKFIDIVNRCYMNQTDSFNCEVRLKKKNGEWVWVYIKGVPIRRDPGTGKMIKMVGIFDNITEYKNTKMELLTILETTADAILVVNNNRKVIHFNQKLVDMWKLPEDLLEEKSDKKLVEYVKSLTNSPDDFSLSIQEAIDNNIDRVDILKLIDGRVIERSYKPFLVNGKNKCGVFSFRDITDQKKSKKLEQKVLIKQKELEKVKKYEKLKTEFFSTISHELKTPLNVILGTTQLLDSIQKEAQRNEVEKIDKYIKIMKQNCYRLLRLINNLIDINKLDSGFLKLDLKNYNIVEVIENICLSVVEYVKSKKINIVFDTEVEEKIMALDADKIERVILNLLSNAVKFTGENGEITINIYDKGENIIISVKDTGIGIPQDMLEKIFTRFKQVNSSLSKKSEGSGIGLSLVKSIVKLHGGEIEVRSEFEKGSEFIIKLPVTKIENKLTHQDEIAIASETNVERIHIEFSDIYS